MRKFLTEPLPYYCSIGAEGVEADTGGDGGGGAPPPGADDQDTGYEEKGSARQSLRQHLEKGFEDDRRSNEGGSREKRDSKGRYQARRGEADDQATQQDQGTQADNQADQGAGGQQNPAPEAFSREAKAAWANTPPTVQAAILKREQDMAKGVEELKGKYSELDKTLQPHMDAIRRHGHTPAQAVGQLFAWFQALAANPQVAFPALAKSFNIDLAALLGQQGQQTQQTQQTQQDQTQGDIPEPVKQYIAGLEKKIGDLLNPITQKIGSLENTFQRTTEEKTNEILSQWSKDKPYFEEVRVAMGQLLQAGAVPLKDGKIDLDKAYDMAIYAIPEVRAKVLAEQAEAQRKDQAAKAEAERKAQAEQAAKARGAGISVNSSAPGAPGQPGQQRKGKTKSVRESLQEAFENSRG